MTAQHTPGPWRSTAEFRDSGAPLFVCALGAERPIICRIENRVSKRPLDDEDYANARLIASAPDLKSENDRLRKVARQALEACCSIPVQSYLHVASRLLLRGRNREQLY